MPITFNSDGGFLAGTISASGNNLFIQTSGSAGIVHLDGDQVLIQSQSSGNKITASLRIENENLVINDNLKVKKDEFRFKSADRTKEVKIDVSDNGNIRFKDNDDKEIVKFREGGRIDLGQNDTANSQSLTNWNGAISASGFVKCKNTFLGHNYGFPDNFILAHSDRVQNEDLSLEAGRGFAFGQNPAGHTFINAGDGTSNGYESINFYQAGLASSILGKNRNWQFGAGNGSVQFEPPEKLTVEGNISASGNLIIQGSISASSINTTIVSSSIVFSSGSNIFGDASSDTHTFTGHITASGNISATGTGSFDGGMIIPNSTRITFGSVDTFISVDNDNPEDLVIASDDDIFISPDDDLFLNADDIMFRTTAGAEYARFNGGVGGLGIGKTVPDQLLHVEGTNAQINIEEDDTEFLRLGVGEDENDAVIGFHTDNFLRIGTYSSPTDTTMFKAITIDYTGNITSSANISASGTITMLTASIGGGIFTSASLAAGGGGGGGSSFSFTGDQFATDLKVGRDSDNHIDFTTDNVMIFNINNASELRLNATSLRPHTNNGLALGSTSTSWSDLYLAEGGFITFDNGDAVITQTGPLLEMSGSGATRLNVKGEITSSKLSVHALANNVTPFIIRNVDGEKQFMNVSKYKKDKEIIKISRNTIYDSLHTYLTNKNFQTTDSLVVTVHRTENIYNKRRLLSLIKLLYEIKNNYNFDSVKWFCHDVTKNILSKNNLINEIQANGIVLKELTTHENFINELITTKLIITDGGSIAEECSILGLNTIVWRDVVENNDYINENVILSNYDYEKIYKFINDLPSNNLILGKTNSPSKELVEKLIKYL